MKYPVIIFYRYPKYNYIDKFLIEFKQDFGCTFFITQNAKDLNHLYNTSKFHLLITFGDEKQEYEYEIRNLFSEHFIKYRWYHYTRIVNIGAFNQEITKLYIDYVIKPREQMRPIFSIFTTCFNSYEKIKRCYNSILNQLLKDWEWIIIDDSPDDDHFNFLKNNIQDKRVRIYKRDENSGSIGNVKNEAISLCRGKYVLEMDHDDEITEDLLSNATDIFENNSEIGFIYTDFINIYENGENWNYGDVICKGYGGYYVQKYNKKWVYVYITPNINNISLSYLVCCPNHARIWRRNILSISLENYSEFLYICDDYDILLRTALNTKIAKLNKMCYIQYMNENENNFSLIRNSEINRIGPNYISPQFYEKYNLNNKMKELNAYEDEKYIHHEHTPIWKRTNYKHVYCNLRINNDYDQQICIIGIEAFYYNINQITSLYQNPRNDFILLDNTLTNENITEILDTFDLDRIKCYSLTDNKSIEMINYFHIMYLSCENYKIIKNENTIYENRDDIINSFILEQDTKYLEIGVECGTTFKNIKTINKIGVDPDPKYPGCIIKTSDDFFKHNKTKFDIIFIDGMHQVEYLIKDINNSINSIEKNGIIFIDDIVPFKKSEQLKIPNKHYYENGILKYGEPWTGDVWKVVYYILKNHKQDIKYSLYINKNYRGVLQLEILKSFQIQQEKIIEINNYDYNNDFKIYITLLCSN